MEVYALRSEIRRRVLARAGYQTDDSQGPLITERINECIRSNAMELFRRCSEWKNAQRELLTTVGIDQRFLNYPTGATAGNILAVAVWTGTQYVPLRRSNIVISQDDEPLVVIGEPDSINGRGQPSLYEPKSQIEIWRRPDKSYEIKIDYTVNTDLQNDTDTSIVDAESIILLTLADLADFDQPGGGTQYRQRAEARINSLRAAESTKQTYSRNDHVRLRRNGYAVRGDLPNSGQWPSVMPS